MDSETTLVFWFLMFVGSVVAGLVWQMDQLYKRIDGLTEIDDQGFDDEPTIPGGLDA